MSDLKKSFFLIQGAFSPPISPPIHHAKSRICYCPLQLCTDLVVDQESVVLRGIWTHSTRKGLLCRDFLLLLYVVFVSAITECLPVVHWAMQLPSGMCLFTHCLPRGRSVCSGVLCFWIFVHRYWHVLVLEMTRSKYMPCTGNEKWWYFECSLVNSTCVSSWTRSPNYISRRILNLMQHFPILHSL